MNINKPASDQPSVKETNIKKSTHIKGLKTENVEKNDFDEIEGASLKQIFAYSKDLDKSKESPLSHKGIQIISISVNSTESTSLDQLPPSQAVAQKIDQFAMNYLSNCQNAKKFRYHLDELNLKLSPERDDLEGSASYFQTLPSTIKKLLGNISQIYAGNLEARKKFENDTGAMLQLLYDSKNSRGENVIQQLSNMFKLKQKNYSELHNLQLIKEALKSEHIEMGTIEKDLKLLSKKTQKLLNIDITNLGLESNDLLNRIVGAIKYIQDVILQPIVLALGDLLQQIDDKLSIYEVSSNRLTKAIPSEILLKPINVTMIGVEFAGFIKEGGLGEALEGMTKSMKNQHPGNEVNLIYPKFSTLPHGVQEKIAECEPQIFKSSNGRPFQVYSIQLGGINYYFIDHPSFVLKGKKPSIYGPDDESCKQRFTAFSALAADLVKHIKTDVIHLHDWHVAGVALKLIKDDPEKWEKGETPPIVFTYHNNSRAAQGRYGQGIYNYQPVIQGLIEAGFGVENLNVFVEVLNKVDAITTVSETFGVESQEMETGEGVSFATRDAASKGKLTGIVNGSNPHSFNPELDPVLKNWTDLITSKPVDLTYGPKNTNLEIIKKKNNVKLNFKNGSGKTFQM